MKVTKCQDCAAWAIDPRQMDQGTCQLKAPVIFPMNTPQGVQFLAMQPMMRREQGCSEGSEKIIIH